MSTTTPKKPPGTGTGAAASSNARKPAVAASNSAGTSVASNRSPSRLAGSETSTTAAKSNPANTLNRVRSVRNSNGAGTPISARAAARRPAASDPADDDAKAEMQAKLDDLQERLQQAEQACEESQKQAAVLQVKLDEAIHEQNMLDEKVHESTERIEELENEKKESLRARRELEQIYEAERVQAMREKEERQAKEEEMHDAMQRMKETLAQREMRDRNAALDDDRRHSLSRTGSFRNSIPSPNPDAGSGGQFAPPSSVQRSDSRSSSRLVMQKDKIIEGLRLELAEAQIKLVELDNRGGGRVHELEKDMYDIKMQNARLMEENESFQLLLSEKTLSGDLNLLHVPSHDASRPPSRSPRQGTSLADELEGQQDALTETSEVSDAGRRFQAEANSLRDQNKALTLYINNIISRLLQHEQFEQILDKTPDLMAGPGAASVKYAGMGDVDKELPPPPPAKDDKHVSQDDQPNLTGGLLQRAKSVMGAGPKKRPVSGVPSMSHEQGVNTEQHTLHENPDTAPRIPLGRSASTRGANGHRRANSELTAASVVTNMYRGPSPGLQGPTSPGLSSPTGRNSFFGATQALGAVQRVVSGNSVPTISEGNKENVQQRDSKLTSPPSLPSTSQGLARSNRNSVISNSAASGDFDPIEGGAELSNPSSPPRSTSSSGDREGRTLGGAIMMGSKPRPLRLVQEAQDDEKAKKAANRGSWFGWMNKGGVPPGGVGGAGGAGGRASSASGESGQ